MTHLFQRKQLVRHIKTNTVYRIIHTPNTCRIEEDNSPAYAYRDTHKIGPLWVRKKEVMEDGRFEPAD